MSKKPDCQLQTIQLSAADWAQLLIQVQEKCQWKQDQPVWAYTESVSKCELKKQSLSEFDPSAGAWEGHIFSTDADVRWRSNPEGTFAVWITREATTGRSVMRTARRYYLIGTWRDGRFGEHRYPSALLDYGVTGNHEDDRAFINVNEYSPAEPAWNEQKDADSIEKLLNQPLVIAHRFVGVEAGRD
jgi:hypothetical protein